jgi:hypothetical protein
MILPIGLSKGGHFFYGTESNKIVDEMADEFLASHGFLNK